MDPKAEMTKNEMIALSALIVVIVAMIVTVILFG